MRANQGTNVVNLNLTLELRNLLLNQRCNRLGILAARRVRHDALARIVRAVLHMRHHGLGHLGDRALLGTDLLARRQLALAINRHKWANLKRRADDRARGRDATAAQITRQVGREEPVMQVELVLLDPSGRFLQRGPAIAHIGGIFHQQAKARGSCQRIDHAHLTALGIAIGKHLRRNAGRTICARNARRQRQMQHVLALGDKRLPKLLVLAHAQLRRLRHGARGDLGKKLVRRNRLIQVIVIDNAINLVMEIHDRNIARRKELAGSIGARFTGQDKITHMRLLNYCCANYRTASLNTVQMSTIYQFEPFLLNIFITNISIAAVGQQKQITPHRLHSTDTSTSTKSI